MKYVVIGLLAIILILLSILIFRAPEKVITKFNDKPYLDTISRLKKRNIVLHKRNDSIETEIQILSNTKQQIIIRYVEKIKFIHGASTWQLDSIIRASW